MTRLLMSPRERDLSLTAHLERLRHLVASGNQLHSLFRMIATAAVVETFALRAASRPSARTPGVDGQTGRQARQQMSRFVDKVERVMRAGAFEPLVVYTKPKTDGTSRPLAVPTLAERAIGMSISWMLNQVFDGSFLPGVACRPGKGNHHALGLAMQFASKATWMVKLDLRDFFGSIRHEAVREKLACRIRDKKLLTLIDRMMRRVPIGTDVPRLRGIPQGCPSSPILANLAAQPVDEWLEARGIHFVRYMDDLVLCISEGSFQDMERLVDELADFLPHLGLELASAKTVIAPAQEGVPFLGHQLFQTSTREGRVRPHPDRVARFRNYLHGRADALNHTHNDKEIRSITHDLLNGVRAFSNYFLPTREAFQIAAHALSAAMQSIPVPGLIRPVGLPLS